MTVSVEFAAETMFKVAVFIDNVSDRRPYIIAGAGAVFDLFYYVAGDR